MIAGGAEATVTELAMGGFASARALSTRNDSPAAASRPWVAALSMQAVMGTNSAPAQVLSDVVVTVIARWRGEAGMVFATLTYLGLHKRVFIELRRRIYADFHGALDGVVTALDRSASREVVAVRVTLITALVDGAAQQLPAGATGEMVKAIARQALMIARGDLW